MGHRYWCIYALAVYAKKCNIDQDELRQDAFSLLDKYDIMTETADNHFTAQDIESALKAAQSDEIVRHTIETISERTSIKIVRNKRNHRSREMHVKIMTCTRDILYPDGSWRNKDGRPKGSGVADKIVKEWRTKNPEGRKVDCIRETGLSKSSVYRWWGDV